MRYNVVKYYVQGNKERFACIIAGHGKNAGTWDCDHSRSAAYRLARELNAKAEQGARYKVEPAL